jgi:endonuclease YncB( thermonuclease family)
MTRHALAVVLALGCLAVHAETITGRVVGVNDGDTITVLDSSKIQHKVRLAGIDAPESKQAFGQASKKHLSDLVFGKDVRVEWKKHDRYGRIVGKVMFQPQDCSSCQHTRDAGLAQLEAGLAWWYREYRREQTLEDQGYYEYAEFDAKAQRRGLWGDADPIPPWEWRKKTQVVAQLSFFPTDGR